MLTDNDKLEKRIIVLKDVSTALEYMKLGDAAIKYGTYENLPENIQKTLTRLERKRKK